MPRRLDERPGTQVHQSSVDSYRTGLYYPAMDKLIAELERRFPNDLGDFKFLQPQNYFLAGADEAINRLARRYSMHLDPAKAANEWRLFRHSDVLLADKSL